MHLRRDEQGKPSYYYAFVTDTTERNQAEAALRESEARFRSLFENMTAGVALYELLYNDQGRAVDYRFVSTNASFEKHTGLKPEQVLGQSWPVSLMELPGLHRRRRQADAGPD